LHNKKLRPVLVASPPVGSSSNFAEFGLEKQTPHVLWGAILAWFYTPPLDLLWNMAAKGDAHHLFLAGGQPRWFDPNR